MLRKKENIEKNARFMTRKELLQKERRQVQKQGRVKYRRAAFWTIGSRHMRRRKLWKYQV